MLGGVDFCVSRTYDDLLTVLPADRQKHSRAVGAKVASVAGIVAPSLRSDLIAAAILHDIGYGHARTGFHPVDGARFLAEKGFSKNVCNLVVHHSASTEEAIERGIPLDIFEEFRVPADLSRAHGVLWWADLTTGPTGDSVNVNERLDEILSRYGSSDPVTRFVIRARAKLTDAGQWPIGSIQVSE